MILSPADTATLYISNIDDPGLRTEFEALEVYGFNYGFIIACALWSLSPLATPNHLNEEIDAIESAYADILEAEDNSDPKYLIAVDYFRALGQIHETLNSVFTWYQDKLHDLGLEHMSDLIVSDAKAISRNRVQITISTVETNQYDQEYGI